MTLDALRSLLASGPVVTGATHPGYTVGFAAARQAALTVAEQAPRDIPVLLDTLGITGRDGPDGGKWAVYSYGRSSASAKGAGSA